MTAIHHLGARELLTAYAAKSLSPVEATRAVLARIEACEPLLHATWAVDAEAALAAASASEARWMQRKSSAGAGPGLLDGVPTMLKENIATRGLAVPLGCAATVLTPAAADAPPAARLREAGAVLIGKTTMPDLGMLSSGLSSFHATACNPWDLTKTPGGSSAGAAAGVAAGYGPLHVGTDIGGSVRLPAGWCGVFALKPSFGRIPIDPPYPGRVAGPMTRTVADAALLMRVLAQPDARDAMSLPPQAIAWHELEPWPAGAGIDLRGLTLGLMLDAGWGLPAEPEVRAAVQSAADAFAAAGATVVPLAPFTTAAMASGIDDFWRTRSWLDLAALPDDRRARVLPFIVEWARGGAGLSGERVFRGWSRMAELRDAANRACAPFDAVLSPTAPMPAFAAELPCPTNDPARPFEHIAFTLPFNMSEQPAASIDCGCTAGGLPIGLQIAGRRFDDLGVLRLARAWERLRPPPRPWPALA